MAEHATGFAPGRVNLIGEHTDYNDGLALPFAIEDGVTVTATRADPGRVSVFAADLDAHDSFDLRSPARVAGWRGFARGVVAELAGSGCRVEAARLDIRGSVPRGSGLSSSAALEVALCLAVLGISDAPVPDRLELARLCSRVENEWVGARTGLLDQIASLFGECDSAMRIDFRSLDIRPVALELGGFTLVTLDSGQRHANARDAGADPDAAAGYNQRRRECARACELLEIESLRDATVELAARLPDPLADRVRHVISENERVDATVEALAAGELERVGDLLNVSHASLRDRYQVSTPAVEETVARLRDAGAVGARIMGGGFGGHVLGLMPPEAEPPAGAIAVSPGRGARLIR
ncbi:MAG TPA: galactokinase family protein [Solirubrobacteraceae bacterium]|nr:galactokinase family protein [Solirubrobacteraceae bacterium]